MAKSEDTGPFPTLSFEPNNGFSRGNARSAFSVNYHIEATANFDLIEPILTLDERLQMDEGGRCDCSLCRNRGRIPHKEKNFTQACSTKMALKVLRQYARVALNLGRQGDARPIRSNVRIHCVNLCKSSGFIKRLFRETFKFMNNLYRHPSISSGAPKRRHLRQSIRRDYQIPPADRERLQKINNDWRQRQSLNPCRGKSEEPKACKMCGEISSRKKAADAKVGNVDFASKRDDEATGDAKTEEDVMTSNEFVSSEIMSSESEESDAET